MKLNKFIDFYLNKLLEGDVNELPIYFTERFKNILLSIKNPLSLKLLSVEDKDDIRSIRTYIDIDEDSIDKITFIMVNKIKDVIDKDFPGNNLDDYREDYLHQHYIDAIYKSKQRASMKINRFVNQLFNNEYSTNKLTEDDKIKAKEENLKTKPEQLEDFVNQYKSLRSPGKFELVNGDELKRWYLGDNYYKNENTLGNSCMKHRSCQDYLKFYSNNDDKVSLLIMKDREGGTKIIGRALVWKLTYPENRYFMDRIYYINDYDIELFKKHASENGWLYKDKQNMQSDEYIVDPTTNEKSKMVLKVDGMVDQDEYPYLDTLKYYDRDNEKLSNSPNKFSDYVTLEGTHGEYSETTGQLSYEELVDRYKDDILDDFEYYAKHIMQDFVWDYVDDDAFMSKYIEGEIDYYVDDFNYLFDKDDIIEYLMKFVDVDRIVEVINDYIDEDDMKDEEGEITISSELLDDNLSLGDLQNLAYRLNIEREMAEYKANERYKDYTAKEILAEMYGQETVDEMGDDIYNTISYYIDEISCAIAYAEGEDEYYLRDRYDN